MLLSEGQRCDAPWYLAMHLEQGLRDGEKLGLSGRDQAKDQTRLKDTEQLPVAGSSSTEPGLTSWSPVAHGHLT